MGDAVNAAPVIAGASTTGASTTGAKGRHGRSARTGEAKSAELNSAESTVGEPRWLAEVRLRAARRVLWLRQLWSGQGYRDEHLLAISHSEVDRALAPGPVAADAEQAFYRSDELAKELTAEIGGLSATAADGRLDHIVGTFGLSGLDTALLMLAEANAVDHAIGRVFGYLLDSTDATDPTPTLAAVLFDLREESPPGPDSPLVKWLLATPVAPPPDAFAWSAGWRADAMLLPALMGRKPRGDQSRGDQSRGDQSQGDQSGGDWSVGCTGRAFKVPAGPVLRPDAVAEVAGFVQGLGSSRRSGLPIEIELVGAPGSGRTTLAAQAASKLGKSLVAVDATALGSGPDLVANATREVRRALLEDAVIAWEHAEAVPPMAWKEIPATQLSFRSVPAPVPGAADYQTIRRSIACAPIGRRERIALWSSLTARHAPPAVADWALRPAEVAVAASVAPAGDHEVAEVCRRMLMASTPELASPLPLPYEWTDLVLDQQTMAHLREFEAQAGHRGEVLDDWGFSRLTSLGRGTAALFAGPSGTGKTMAAQVLARSLGLDLYRVDLAGVVSKYIGETEKRLRDLFEACERAPVLLLFDEADALFGKRTQVRDAHDRYANIEIDYVLQRMEQFDGVAVLATNRKGDLDTAFVRRLRFIIDFASPGPAERERLWRIALEGATDMTGTPLTGQLNWHGLGRELDLTGAGIKSVVLAAAFLAWGDGSPITERHVLAAARRELAKQGVVVRSSQVEPQ